VNQENTTPLEPNNQILAATLDRDDTLALELGRDRLRVERADDPGVRDLHLLEHAADERRLEARADGLDLGQLGQARSLLRRRRRG
jgi:hypothetical protein